MNRKLLITAPMHYSQRLLKAFERYKDRVDVLHIPMVESTFDNTSEQMRELRDNLDKYDFVIPLSRKAIESMHFHWHNRKELGSARFLAIGKDNDYMRELMGIEPPFVSTEPSPMGIAKELERRDMARGKRMAVVGPAFKGMEEPRTVPDFLDELERLGTKIKRFGAYLNMPTELRLRKKAYELIKNKDLTGIAFTSGSEVVAFSDGLKEVYGKDAHYLLGELTLCYLGPYTAKQANLTGLKTDIVSTCFNSFDDFTAYLAENEKRGWLTDKTCRT